MNTRPVPFPSALAADSLKHFHRRPPLIHCLTNDVVQSFTANVLLALGASPAMVVERSEAAQFSALADALLINIGTLEPVRADAMRFAVASANRAERPWVLDPVAVGALTFRSDFARELLALRPAAVRGNASEILALSGAASQGRGVDSGNTSLAALPAARELARRWSVCVAVTGEVDYVTDGERDWAVAGFCALPGDRLQHIAAACAVMSECGQRAANGAGGPGSFIPRFLDQLFMAMEAIAK
ncbi:hydroxyethylthiazole kinase [Lonsdalea quercina]|uniref:hydroxyethylthiazole kinase n=1 Tax=Lonsdalea quercina TaxID=71657 RepID=UPI0039753BBF